MLDRDLELAKLWLKERNLTLVVVKEGRNVFETKSQGINGFLQAIEKLGKRLVASSVADKIVGAAAATLCVCSKVSAVFAVTISKGGIRVLKENNIFCEFENEVLNILNSNKKEICPFERLVVSSVDLEEAYTKLRSFSVSGRKKLD